VKRLDESSRRVCEGIPLLPARGDQEGALPQQGEARLGLFNVFSSGVSSLNELHNNGRDTDEHYVPANSDTPTPTPGSAGLRPASSAMRLILIGSHHQAIGDGSPSQPPLSAPLVGAKGLEGRCRGDHTVARRASRNGIGHWPPCCQQNAL
jgi:hypothetical protein